MSFAWHQGQPRLEPDPGIDVCRFRLRVTVRFMSLHSVLRRRAVPATPAGGGHPDVDSCPAAAAGPRGNSGSAAAGTLWRRRKDLASPAAGGNCREAGAGGGAANPASVTCQQAGACQGTQVPIIPYTVYCRVALGIPSTARYLQRLSGLPSCIGLSSFTPSRTCMVQLTHTQAHNSFVLRTVAER